MGDERGASSDEPCHGGAIYIGRHCHSPL